MNVYMTVGPYNGLCIMGPLVITHLGVLGTLTPKMRDCRISLEAVTSDQLSFPLIGH